MRYLAGLILIIVLVAAGAFVYAGRQPGPVIEIVKPVKYVGQSTPLEVTIATSDNQLRDVAIVFEQNGKSTTLFSLAQEQQGKPASQPVLTLVKSTPGAGTPKAVVTTTISRDRLPDLKSGPARIVVTATRPVLRGLRTIESRATRDLQVRLERPTIAVLSTKHYVNLGGSEMVVYRATPADVESGVQVGDLTYPGYPASGAKVEGVQINDPAVKVAFFALRFDQDVNTPMFAYARDEAGNAARADFDHLSFPKPFKRSNIQIAESFIDRVVPAILETTTEIKPEGDTLQKFIAINSDLRRLNSEKIASLAKQSSPDMIWAGVVFHPFTNSAVEAAFADHRTYFYNGKQIDQQVHLGFDLARTANSPVVAANKGKVVYAAPLGIYGNCIILDHGMGVQSLYGHLSSISVQVGQMVEKEQEMGRSGTTGLAQGDHLHFTMLVNGQMVNPVEWWDAHWIQDRILRKLHEASATTTTARSQ